MHIYTFTDVDISVYICIHMYICSIYSIYINYMLNYIYIYIYIYIHIYMYIYIYI